MLEQTFEDVRRSVGSVTFFYRRDGKIAVSTDYNELEDGQLVGLRAVVDSWVDEFDIGPVSIEAAEDDGDAE